MSDTTNQNVFNFLPDLVSQSNRTLYFLPFVQTVDIAFRKRFNYNL